ncbi:MAG: FAD-binding protein [Actinomycetes bacterium]
MIPALRSGPLEDVIDTVRATVAAAPSVVPVGARTHWDVGGEPTGAVEVRAPAGIVEYEPAELTITVGAGTTIAQLDEVLAASGQQCPLDPRDPAATVGGVLAVGLSGPRRLRYRPLRDRLLEVHLVTGDARRVKGGGRVVKNVSGYDVCRLTVGSLGTLGVIVQVTLRCEPRPAASSWFACPYPGDVALARAYRPSTVLTDGRTSTVLVEGAGADLDEEQRRLGGVPTGDPLPLPTGPHRGRIAVRPRALAACGADLDALELRWCAEAGIGTVHVATDDEDRLAEARAVAATHGGWMLREAGAPGLDPFGTPLPVDALQARIKAALDPGGVCNPGRLPYPRPAEVPA